MISDHYLHRLGTHAHPGADVIDRFLCRRGGDAMAEQAQLSLTTVRCEAWGMRV